MVAFIDLTGQRFERWTVLTKASTKNRSIQWGCICDCGTEKIVAGASLRTGNSKSCGCLTVEAAIARNVANKKHGMSYTKTHQVWSAMKERCINSSHQAFSRYGGRGIKVCQRWLESFQNFLDDMGEPPPGMSLDRKDVDGNYEPSNCRWATDTEQANNRRNTIYVEFDGRTQSVADWAREVGIPHKTLKHRIKTGWMPEKALTMSVNKANNNHWRAAA